MFRTLFSIILIVAAVIGIAMYVVPTYQGTQDARTEERQFDVALANSRRLQAARDELLAKFNAFPKNDIDRLETLLPDNIDNVKLIIELDSLALQHGLAIQNINVLETEETPQSLQESEDRSYGIVDLNFSVAGPYERFVNFIEDIEGSLRLIDVQSISFQSTTVTDNYQYELTVRTYWLK